MDVSHTEHSHVIGKGGNNIKRVMEETGCHIHFPDSNRNNQAEKSNQVCTFSLMSWITALHSAAQSVSYHHPLKTDFLRFQVLNNSLICVCSPPIHLLAVTGSQSGQVAESWFTRVF